VTRVSNYGAEPFFHRPFGLNYITTTGFMVNAYRAKYGLPEMAAAKVVVKNRGNALNNPLACYQTPVSTEEVLSSRIVAWPVRAMDMAPLCDGACALVLASEERARGMVQPPVWIQGMGWATETYYLGERDLSRLTSLEVAARRAYAMAGVTNPLRELDVAEIHDIADYHELMAYEALGLCPWGQAARLMEEGVTEMGGRLPVNPSGGALSGSPFFATGLVRLAEAALQVRGDAGRRQVKGAKRALAHGSYGFCGQGNSVFILGE
jgi:acetyl-CoA C-acetyltransferase